MQEDDPSKKHNTPGGSVRYNVTQRARRHALFPRRPVAVITETGPIDVLVDQVVPADVGLKAYGLSSLPSEWVPPFFVIAGSCFEGTCSDEAVDAWIAQCLSRVGIGGDRPVMVRSSGSAETMRDRGRLLSKLSSPPEVRTTIRKLIAQLPKIADVKVNWIVQEHVQTKKKGQLSNERHVSRENRDWAVEFEPEGDLPGRSERMGIRQWRDGTEVGEFALSCTSALQVTLRLKHVAMWATQLSVRTHFEWVWDGKTVYIVQVDVADPATGIDPHSLLPAHIPAIEVSSLQAFRPANEQDYDRLMKLRNARLYGQLGYTMPVFYVVDDHEVMNAVLAGQIPPNLAGDLAKLTTRSLVIRTDGTSIPSDKREMLPRSEELRSSAQAEDWLLNHFKPDIERNDLGGGHLCLVAHHFVPSVASAWARAEPGNRIVRIESLWGIPEGLYWHSHDTFEVDTLSIDLDVGQPIKSMHYKRRARPRYKGTFIAPDSNGNWVAHRSAPPYDWLSSIRKRRWLFEIARTTRQVAELEKYPVTLMWFIDNHAEATLHQVLPWYHSKSKLAGSPKAAPRRKLTSTSDFRIRNVADWERLQQYLRSPRRIVRVVVEPVDPELIRNSEFARQLAALAASEKFVVELSGGTLSHVYYILQRHGARVECADLFGADEDVIEYNKVVRDKIPRIIEARGEYVEKVRLAGDALVAALAQKLVEEAFEALDAKSGETLVGELADVEEVVRGLCHALEITPEEIESVRIHKRKRRGGFDSGLMLTKTATPHSIQKQASPSEPPHLELKAEQAPEPVISDETQLPAKPLYRRPDLRQVEKQLEKLFTFATEINRIKDLKATLDFSMPLSDQQEQPFTLTIELRRTQTSIRGTIRLRTGLSPLPLDFPSPQLDIESPDKN